MLTNVLFVAMNGLARSESSSSFSDVAPFFGDGSGQKRHDYKLVADPFILIGAKKIYRVDGAVQGQPVIFIIILIIITVLIMVIRACHFNQHRIFSNSSDSPVFQSKFLANKLLFFPIQLFGRLF